MLVAFFLLGAALFSGDLLPPSFRILMLIAGLGPFFGLVLTARARRESSADYNKQDSMIKVGRR